MCLEGFDGGRLASIAYAGDGRILELGCGIDAACNSCCCYYAQCVFHGTAHFGCPCARGLVCATVVRLGLTPMLLLFCEPPSAVATWWCVRVSQAVCCWASQMPRVWKGSCLHAFRAISRNCDDSEHIQWSVSSAGGNRGVRTGMMTHSKVLLMVQLKVQ